MFVSFFNIWKTWKLPFVFTSSITKVILSCSSQSQYIAFCPGSCHRAVKRTPFLHWRHLKNSFLTICSQTPTFPHQRDCESPRVSSDLTTLPRTTAPMCRFVPTIFSFLGHAELFWTSRSTMGNGRKSPVFFTLMMQSSCIPVVQAHPESEPAPHD